jgi:Glycine rich protein
MRAFAFSRCAFGISVAAASLCACSGSSMPVYATGNATAHNATSDIAPLKNRQAFDYTGKKQMFIVPAGVNKLTVVARGGEGAGFSVYPSGNPPGFPGRVYALIPVHPGDTLYVFVGGAGAHGGFNGGGAGGTAGSGGYTGNPGGGASDVRMGGDKLADRIIVAAGGGGAGEAINAYGDGYGGNGGGMSGQSGGSHGSYNDGTGGGGGTQSAGGSGGVGGRVSRRTYLGGQPGSNGALGLGGHGGNGGPYCYAAGAGGGGGGYYGGGGGGGAAAEYLCYNSGQSGGGGGGSSYVEPSAIKSRMWTGWKRKGDGHVIFSWN